MTDFHDPVRQAETLSELYSQDKRPLSFFLTAGCPYSVHVGDRRLLPDIAGLTDMVGENLTPQAMKERFSLAIRTLTGDGVANPTIEDVLTYIRALRVVAGNDRVREFTGAELEELDVAIAAEIVKTVNVELPIETSPFNNLAAWIGSISRAHAVELFTTNYDLLFEQALERAHVPFFDGFVGSRQAFFDTQAIEEDVLPARWARLWKLHGSINWELDKNGNTIRSGNATAIKCPLIHPSHLKYAESRRMPYLAMIDRMRSFMRQPSATTIVCGYSFKDEHLNEVLMQGAQGNPSAATFALLFGALNSYSSAVKIAQDISNFNVLARDEAVIGARRLPWRLPQTASPPEQLGTFWESGAVEEDLIAGQFLLGDFVKLGSFLAMLVAARAP